VTTTLIVLVMKVFDIPKVMTAGQFDTNVLANEMFQQAFTNFNRGLGAAVAMVLFFLVLPVMILNIRRDAEAAV
jgi:alpha-glucoside transport system permease protein